MILCCCCVGTATEGWFVAAAVAFILKHTQEIQILLQNQEWGIQVSVRVITQTQAQF